MLSKETTSQIVNQGPIPPPLLHKGLYNKYKCWNILVLISKQFVSKATKGAIGHATEKKVI